MEIGSAAINILVDTWEGHLTPPEAASLADRASRGRDPNMVKAAAELALSCLPHAHALNPSEVQRALFQCKEQSLEMLEKACLAVESAAKGGGVYPEVLFDVARQWFELSEEAAQSSQNDSTHRNHAERDNRNDSTTVSPAAPPVSAAERKSPNTSVIPPHSFTPPHSCAPVTISNAQLFPPHAAAGQIPAQPVVLSYAIPQANLHPTSLPPQPYGYVPQLPTFGPQYSHQHIPIHSHNIHPYVTTFYQNQPHFSNLQGIPNPANVYPANAAQFRALPPAVQVFPSHSCQVTQIQAPPTSSICNGQSMNQLVEQSVDGVSQSPSPPHSAGLGGPGINFGGQAHTHNEVQFNYLLAAFRVGMLALETLARRVHDDRPQTKYARNPPYGEDVKWLLNIALKLGKIMFGYVFNVLLSPAFQKKRGILSLNFHLFCPPRHFFSRVILQNYDHYFT